jgi:hypothetical protein
MSAFVEGGLHINYFNENKKRTDLSARKKLCLIDSYDKLNLSSLSQQEGAAKSGVSVTITRILNTT